MSAEQVAAPAVDASRQLVQAVLVASAATQELAQRRIGGVAVHHRLGDCIERLGQVHRRGQRIRTTGEAAVVGAWRSEEHTSELQSRFDLVCRLLLEKKK